MVYKFSFLSFYDTTSTEVMSLTLPICAVLLQLLIFLCIC